MIDVVGQRSLLRSGANDAAVPENMNDAISERRIALMEGAVEGDDALMEKYLEEETLSDE